MQLSFPLGRTASLLLLLSAGRAALALPVQPQGGGASGSGLSRKPGRELAGRSLLQFHRRSNANAVPAPTGSPRTQNKPRTDNKKFRSGVKRASSAGAGGKAAPKPRQDTDRKSKTSNKGAVKRAKEARGKAKKAPKTSKVPRKPGVNQIYPSQAQRLRSTLSRSSATGGGGGNRPHRPSLAPLVIPAPSNNGPSSTTVEVGSPRPPLTSPDNSLPPILPPASPNSPARPPGPPPSPAGGNSGDALSQGAFGSSMPTVLGQMDWGRPGHPGGKQKE